MPASPPRPRRRDQKRSVGVNEPGSVGEALGAAIDALRATGVESPRLDAELLMAEATGLDRAAFVARPETPLPGAAARRFAETVRRRLRREPVAYILGRRWFRELELRCDRRALIPRPETELLVEVALGLGDRLAAERGGAAEQAASGPGAGGEAGAKPAPGRPRVLDIGTGTGAVALAIASERPGWQIAATDTSPDALSLARENAELYGLAGRVELVAGTLPDASRFDVVVANLPYVPDGDWGSLAPEIRDYEPKSALLAGPDGLDVVSAVVGVLAAEFAPALPAIALEIGDGQAEATAGILRDAGWLATEARRDLAGIDRVVIGHPQPF